MIILISYVDPSPDQQRGHRDREEDNYRWFGAYSEDLLIDLYMSKVLEMLESSIIVDL
jgi:hypothetical protein